MEAAFAYAFHRYFPDGQPPFERYKRHLGKGFTAIMDELGLPRELYPHFRERSASLIHEIAIFPGAKECLQTLSMAGAYVGIATGKDRRRTLEILACKGLDRYIDRVVCSDDVAHGKPAPDSINAHLEGSQLARTRMLFVGDAEADILCARSAGVCSIAVTWGGMADQQSVLQLRPDYVTHTFPELRMLFGRLGILSGGEQQAEGRAEPALVRSSRLEGGV
jgi:AHBA synthesis associated protein